MSSVRFPTCPVESCGVAVGSRHSKVCTIARCKAHGEQFFSCTNDGEHTPSLFKGDYPGATEAIERGWFVRLVEGKGWVPCLPSELGAMPDLNRVLMELHALVSEMSESITKVALKEYFLTIEFSGCEAVEVLNEIRKTHKSQDRTSTEKRATYS